jgi:YcxB-like protein
MDFPIKAQYNFCYEVLKYGVKLHCRHGSRWIRFVPHAGATLMLLPILAAFFGKGLFLAVFPFAFLGLLLLLIPQFTLWIFRRQFRLNPSKNVEIIWTFTEDGLGSQGEGFNSNMDWRKVFRFVDTEKGFLIYPQKNLFFWIPFVGFTGPNEIEAVRGVAKLKALRYERIA